MRYYRKCKCCLEGDNLKDLWSEYINDGQTEVYGDMINECFSLPWEEPTEDHEYICELCIERLRYSVEFRREIMTAQEIWTGLIEKETEDKIIKKEQESGEEYQEYENLESEEEQDLTEYEVVLFQPDEKQDEDAGDEPKAQYLEYGSSQEEPGEGSEQADNDDMMVEYLEEESDDETKIPAKRKKINKSAYKNYTATDLQSAVQSVVEGRMTRAEAALMFNIPVKTLGAKIRARDLEVEEDPVKSAINKKHQLFYDEIRMILTYTNATPYKTKIGKFFCAYCGKAGPIFRDPDLLRTHTRTKHAGERLKHVDNFMRPVYLNEVLKLDIQNLHCTVCMLKLNDWNAMFQHLLEVHDVTLDQAYSRVIPYILSDDLLCSLCNEKFSHFHMLDVHMNSHYNNYICEECGDTFISESRWKKHMQTHSTQQFPCSDCGKVFSLDKYRKKHSDFVHKKVTKFQCHYCKDLFTGEYPRHLHEVQMHKEFVKKINCEFCKASFTWRPYYLKHMRLSHKKKEKKHQCKICFKRFLQKHELKNHLEWHRGDGFTCDLCDKKFSSRGYLQKHLTSKHPESEGVYVILKEGESGGKKV